MTFPSRRLTGPDTLRRHFNMVNQSKGTVSCFLLPCWLASCWVNIQLELGDLRDKDMFFGPAWAKRLWQPQLCPKSSVGNPYVYEKHRATYFFLVLWFCYIWPRANLHLRKRFIQFAKPCDIGSCSLEKMVKMCEHVFGVATCAYCILRLSLHLQVGQVQALLLFEMGRCRCRIGAKWHVTEQVLRMSVLLWIRELKQKQELFVAWGAHQWCI